MLTHADRALLRDLTEQGDTDHRAAAVDALLAEAVAPLLDDLDRLDPPPSPQGAAPHTG